MSRATRLFMQYSLIFSDSNELPFPVVFNSVGINVDKIMANRTPVIKKLAIIGACRNYDMIKGDSKSLAEELLGK
jgi:hypothetical protein